MALPCAERKLGIWDGGNVRGTRRTCGQGWSKDNTSTGYDDHATHVSGTMIAAGINPVVRGMSFGAQQLIAYDFNVHIPEMLAEAPSLLVSNHSYSVLPDGVIIIQTKAAGNSGGDAGAYRRL